MKSKRHQPPKSGEVGVTIIASGRQLPMRSLSQGVVACVFHPNDPEATWQAWRHFLSDTLRVDDDLRLHDLHMVKSSDAARLLNFQDFRELSDPELRELILYLQPADYSGPEPPALPKAGKRRAPGCCILDDEPDKPQQTTSKEARPSRGQPSSGAPVPPPAKPDLRDLLSSTRRQGLCRQDSGTSVASSSSSSAVGPPGLCPSPLRTRPGTQHAPVSSPLRRSSAYPLRRLPDRPLDPSPPSSPPSPPTPSPARRRTPAAPSPNPGPNPGRPLPGQLQPSPGRTTRTSTLGRDGTQQPQQQQQEEEEVGAGRRDRPPGDRPTAPMPSPVPPRAAESTGGEAERRGRKRGRAGMGNWEEEGEEGEGREQGPRRDAPAHDDITTSPARPRTRLLGAAAPRSKVQEGAGSGSGTMSGGASISGKSTGGSEDTAPASADQSPQDEQDSEAGILHGDLAESLKQDAISRHFCSATNKKLANDYVDRSNRILAKFVAKKKSFKAKGLPLDDSRARASFFLKHRDEMYYMTERMDDPKKLLDTFRLLFYWGIGKEQNGRQDISWMPDAERDKVKEKEERQDKRSKNKP